MRAPSLSGFVGAASEQTVESLMCGDLDARSPPTMCRERRRGHESRGTARARCKDNYFLSLSFFFVSFLSSSFFGTDLTSSPSP